MRTHKDLDVWKHYIALGSASELDTQIEISKATGLGDTKQLAHILGRIGTISKMLYGLIGTINK